MSTNLNDKRDNRSAADNHNEFPSLLSPQAGCHRQVEGYYASSGLESIYASSYVDKAGSSSAVFTDPSVRSLGPNSEGDYEVNDQMSTEPVPTDFDYQAVDVLSSPPSPSNKTPITRSKARATALAVGRNEDGKLLNPISKIECREPRENNHEHLPLPNSHRRNPTRVKPTIELPRINGLDGSVDEHSSIPAGDPGDSALGSGSSILNSRSDDDDIYHITESDAGGEDSETSAVADIIGHSGRKSKRKATTTTYSSKSTKKRVSKTREGTGATNQASGLSANKSGRPRKALSHPTGKSRGSINRRPKKPFNASNLVGFQASPQDASPTHGNTNSYQHSMARQGAANYSVPNKIEPLVSKSAQTTNQKSRSTPLIPYSGVEHEKCRYGVKSPEVKERLGGIGHSQRNSHSDEMSDPFAPLSSDQHSESTDMEYGHVHPQTCPNYNTKTEPNKRPSGFEPGTRLTKKINAPPDMEAPCENVEASATVYSPHVNTDMLYSPHLSGPAGEAKPVNHSGAETLLQLNYDQMPEEKEIALGGHTFDYGSHRLPQVEEASRSSSAEDISAGFGAHRQQAINPKRLPLPRRHRDSSEAEESLHPNSMVWAEKMAESSRKKHLISRPFEVPGAIGSSDETPPMERKPGVPQVSKREITLKHRRGAVSESVQEVTMAMLQHMGSRESTVNEIVENYRRNGQQLLDRLLDRQAIELNDAISAFDMKCVHLNKVFDDGVRLTRTVYEKVTNPDDQYHRAWTQRSKELDEEIKMA